MKQMGRATGFETLTPPCVTGVLFPLGPTRSERIPPRDQSKFIFFGWQGLNSSACAMVADKVDRNQKPRNNPFISMLFGGAGGRHSLVQRGPGSSTFGAVSTQNGRSFSSDCLGLSVVIHPDPSTK